MLCRAPEPDQPVLLTEFRDNWMVGQHSLVTAVARHLYVASVPGEVVDRANLLGAHPPLMERSTNGVQWALAQSCGGQALHKVGRLFKQVRQTARNADRDPPPPPIIAVGINEIGRHAANVGVDFGGVAPCLTAARPHPAGARMSGTGSLAAGLLKLRAYRVG
jgi:hypothetical protein